MYRVPAAPDHTVLKCGAMEKVTRLAGTQKAQVIGSCTTASARYRSAAVRGPAPSHIAFHR